MKRTRQSDGLLSNVKDLEKKQQKNEIINDIDLSVFFEITNLTPTKIKQLEPVIEKDFVELQTTVEQLKTEIKQKTEHITQFETYVNKKFAELQKTIE